MYPGERFNCLSHLAGLFVMLSGSVHLLNNVIQAGDPYRITGVFVFSITVTLLFITSAIYHGTREPRKTFWERLDHCSIYFVIAGTVTPFILRDDMGYESWLLLALIWSLSILGVYQQIRSAYGIAPSIWVFLGLGWIGVISVLREWRFLSTASLSFLLIGAILYTIGTIFYSNKWQFRHAHGIWHLFVLGGAICHYFSIRFYVL
jgi:hemolysin III